VFSRMHQSMVISTPQRMFKTHHHQPSTTCLTRANDSMDESKDNRSQKYAFDDLDGRVSDGDDFPVSIGAARKFLVKLAHEHLQTVHIPGDCTKASSRAPSQDGSAMYSSDEYIEVLVSSDDSFVDEEEEILEEIVSSPLASTTAFSS
jgi:hypothetical protein